MEGRLVEKYDRKGILAASVSGSYAEQLSEAYRILNEERGFKMKSPGKKEYRAKRVRI